MSNTVNLSLGGVEVEPSAQVSSKDSNVITPLEKISPMVSALRATFRSGATRSLQWREAQLKAIGKMIRENQDRMVDAIYKDLRRDPALSKRIVNGCLKSADYFLEHVADYMKPQEKFQKGIPNTCEVIPTPRGVCLIIGTWNFPFPLVLKPLITSIAAGNTTCLKLSEISVNCSNLLTELITKYLDTSAIAICQGSIPVATEVLKQKFDLIFYTGNPAVGRVVMRAAAENLTPCILELGGKNPAIVTCPESNAAIKENNIKYDSSLSPNSLANAAFRIISARTANGGQFCVAPDYVLVLNSQKETFLKHLKAALRQLHGDEPQSSEKLGRIINGRHVARLQGLLDDHKARGGSVFNADIGGGKVVKEDLYVAPSICVEPDKDARLLQEEIFGPILPVLGVESVEDAIQYVNARNAPLALYAFGQQARKVVESTHSGGACINACLLHMANECLPFGGFGESGMGSYHGEYGFRAFSHERALLTLKKK
eukprot:g3643.t1